MPVLNREEARTSTFREGRGISTHTSTDGHRVELRLDLSIRRLSALLYGVITTLLLLSLSFGLFNEYFPNIPGGGWLQQATDLDGEANVPTLFSMGLLLVSSALSFLIARTESSSGAVPSRSGYWRLLSVLLLLMAADELLMFHETVGGFLDRVFHVAGVYTWVLPGALLVVWFIQFFLRFFRSLPGTVRTSLLLSLLLFVGGAVGVEVLEGLNRSVTGEFGLRGLLLTNMQETLEMLGAAVLLKTLLVYIRDFLAYPCTQMAARFID